MRRPRVRTTVGGGRVVHRLDADDARTRPPAPSRRASSTRASRSAWGNVSWTAATPSGTAIALAVRTGNTPTPDGTWTAFASVANGGAVPGNSRYIQYQAALSTTDSGLDASPAGRHHRLRRRRRQRRLRRSPAGRLRRTPRTSRPTPTSPSSSTSRWIRPRSRPRRSACAAGRRQRRRGHGVVRSGTPRRSIPTRASPPNTVYKATVNGTVTDTSGNALGATSTWTFTTAAIGRVGHRHDRGRLLGRDAGREHPRLRRSATAR